MKSSLLFLLTCSYYCLTAQQHPKAKLSSPTPSQLIVNTDSRYRFDQFAEGNVYYKNGVIARGKMNFNMLLQEIQFIHDNGDTLSLANTDAVDFVLIDNHKFYYDKEVLEIIGDYKLVKLALKNQIKIADHQKEGGYGQSSSTGSISSLNSVSMDNRFYTLSVNETIILSTRKSYFIRVGENPEFLPATKANIVKAYPKLKKSINEYVDRNTVDFKKQDELEKLLDYISHIQVN